MIKKSCQAQLHHLPTSIRIQARMLINIDPYRRPTAALRQRFHRRLPVASQRKYSETIRVVLGGFLRGFPRSFRYNRLPDRRWLSSWTGFLKCPIPRSREMLEARKKERGKEGNDRSRELINLGPQFVWLRGSSNLFRVISSAREASPRIKRRSDDERSGKDVR
jgi:hypothetical protein